MLISTKCPDVRYNFVYFVSFLQIPFIFKKVFVEISRNLIGILRYKFLLALS